MVSSMQIMQADKRVLQTTGSLFSQRSNLLATRTVTFIILTVLFVCTDALINTDLRVASTIQLAGQQLAVLSIHERELVTPLVAGAVTIIIHQKFFFVMLTPCGPAQASAEDAAFSAEFTTQFKTKHKNNY